MENRVVKHLRLEINIVCVCAYCDLHLPAGPASQVILRGFEDVKNVQKTPTVRTNLVVHTHDILTC